MTGARVSYLYDLERPAFGMNRRGIPESARF
jgi:hypothetical protein